MKLKTKIISKNSNKKNDDQIYKTWPKSLNFMFSGVFFNQKIIF
jgi:hypothetical protein